jgi:sterol desaturase/sphingolipid hydroxylase (fatty acid hydroxylase superfamily)
MCSNTQNFVVVMSRIPLLSACWQNVLQSFQAVAAVISPFPTIANSFSTSAPLLAFGTWWSWFSQRYSPWQVELAVTVFVQLIGFWVPASAYLLIDICFPEFSKAHKHQPEPHRQPSRAEIFHCIRYAFLVTLGDIAFQIGLGYLTDFHPLFVITSTLPKLEELARHFVWGNIAREVLGYYVHRILHLPRFYARYHKLHHSFTAPIAFTGLYTTPVEHFFTDIIPIVLPLALLAHFYEPVHILSFNCFLISVLLVGTAEHSGYDFAQPPISKAHDLHHEKFNIHYGSLHFMDWLHGTNVPKQQRSLERKETMKGVGSRPYIYS